MRVTSCYHAQRFSDVHTCLGDPRYISQNPDPNSNNSNKHLGPYLHVHRRLLNGDNNRRGSMFDNYFRSLLRSVFIIFRVSFQDTFFFVIVSSKNTSFRVFTRTLRMNNTVIRLPIPIT